MAIKKINDSILTNIAEAIREKGGSADALKPSEMADAILDIEAEAVIESKNISANGTYTAPSGVDGFSPVVVNVPNSYSASDEGKVVDNGALVAQTSRTIDENGTYDTTLNNEVVVDVEGGGGGESSTFNFPDYLAHSDQAKIAVSAKPDDFTSGSSSWDGMTVAGTPTKEDYYLNFDNSSYASFALSGANTDVTVYAIIKQYSVQSDGRVLFSIPYSGSGYNCPQYYSANGTLNSSVWGSDSAIGSASEWHVLSISIDGTNRKAYYYMDGVYLHEKSFSNSGGSVYLNSNTTSSVGRNSVAFFGIVEELESQATIIANQEDLLTIFKMTQFMNEYSGYLDTPVIAGASEPQSAVGANGDLFVEFEIESNVTNLKNTYNKVSGEWVKNSGLEPIDYSYLPSSVKANVLASSDYTMLDGLKVGAFDVFVYPSLYNLTSTPFELTVDANGLYLQYGVKVGKWLSDANTDVTMYFVGKRTTNTRNFVFMDIPYALSNGNSPSFYNNNGTYAVESTIFASNAQTGYSSDTEHIYAISLDASTKTAKWYIDGNLLRTYNYGNSGNIALIGGGVPTTLDYDSDIYFKYGGVVEECESDATIIANMQAIATKLGLTI